jgi:excisionase family DNA binding protein
METRRPLKAKDVAKLCNVSYSSVLKAINLGKLVAGRVGSTFRIDPTEYDRWRQEITGNKSEEGEEVILKSYETEIGKFGLSMLHALAVGGKFHEMKDPMGTIRGVVRYLETEKLPDKDIPFWEAMRYWSKPGYRRLGINPPPIPKELKEKGFVET